jgi:AcrR family transcriptional regulator
VASISRVEKSHKQRVPAAERRDALIDAAIEEFAAGGLHGTPVDRIARRVGVAQPYVFSLFATKRDLFIAGVERCFQSVSDLFEEVASQVTASPGFDPENCLENPVLLAIGSSYIELLQSDRKLLMLQLHSYAACDDPVIREHVLAAYQGLMQRVKELAGVADEEIQEFMAFGLFLTVQAAMGAPDLEGLKRAHMDVIQARGQGQE